jgi:hypothetical protein
MRFIRRHTPRRVARKYWLVVKKWSSLSYLVVTFARLQRRLGDNLLDALSFVRNTRYLRLDQRQVGWRNRQLLG